jgi:hypothetical protein
MPPSNQTDERRGSYYHQLPVVPQPSRKGDPSLLPLAKRESLYNRKTLLTKLEMRRKVKFSTIKTALLEDVPRASQMLDQEKNLLWWNREELNESLESIHMIMRSMSKRPRSKNGTVPHHTLLYRIDDTCMVAAQEQTEPDNSEDIKLLSDWHRNTLSKRGLEKLVLNSGERNRKIIETIVHATTMVSKNENINEGTKAESIRVCSERLTKPARLFARALGEADASCSVSVTHKRGVRRATELLQ